VADRTVEEWLTEIENGLLYRREYGKEEAWAKNEKNYLNDLDSDTIVGSNLVFAMGDTLASSLNVPDPEFVVTAETQEAVATQPIVESIDNWLVGKMKLKRAADVAVINGYLFGNLILKIGFDSEFGYSPYYDIGPGNNPYGMTFTQFDRKGNRIEYRDIEPGMPWVTACSPHDIVVPWGTQFIDSAPWVAHRIIRPTADIKADPKYVNTSRLEPRMSVEDYMQSYGALIQSRMLDRYNTQTTYENRTQLTHTILWEIHDRQTGRIIVVSPDYDKFLRRDIDAIQRACGHPFVSHSFVTHPRAFWSTPLAYYLGQIQNEQFDIAMQAVKQRRIACLKFLARDKGMSEAERNKLLSGDVGAVGLVKGSWPLGDIFKEVPQGTNKLLELDMQSKSNRADARETIGFSRNDLGEELQSTRRTGIEARFINRGSQRRVSRRAGAVIGLYVDTIMKVNQLLFSFWKRPRSRRVADTWVQFTGEEIRGDYSYSATLSTKRNVSIAERKMESLMLAIQLLQAGLPLNPQAFMSYINDAANDPAFEQLLQGGQALRQLSPGKTQTSLTGAAAG